MENNQNNNEKQGKGKHYLIVVDMQKDFIDGSLGTEEAQGIVEKVKEKILSYPKEMVYATLDTHGPKAGGCILHFRNSFFRIISLKKEASEASN